MDAQFWIYVVIVAIYFLSRLFKKPEQETGKAPESHHPEKRVPSQTHQPPNAMPRQLTFEELLREITEGKQAEKQQRAPEPAPAYEPYEKDPGEEARGLERVDFDEAENARKWKPYEEIPVRALERKSLEETLRLEDTVINFGKFEAFENKQRTRLLDDYIKIIRNPATLRQAVVISEILKRKF